MGGSCGSGMTKSMMLVVPPARPAAVPVKKSSAVTVPMNGSCMWVWGSMPPGRMYWPLASRVCAPAGACAAASAPSATMRPSTHSRSAACSRSALTTVPPRITRAWFMGRSPSGAWIGRGLLFLCAQVVVAARHGQAEEPARIEKREPERRQASHIDHARHGQIARQAWQHAQQERDQRLRVPAVAVLVLAATAVPVIGLEMAAAHQVVVDQQDAGDGAQQRAVAAQPGEQIAAGGGQQFPGHE